ncbi:MAG: glucohydrolase, partial [Clostridia bacterium]|nr:glucohydrolase [Clostridia bacterium]
WNMLYLENHDHPRIISRYGSEKYWQESGKTLAVAYLFQQGTPFLYQGQEIGMLNWQPASPDMYEDVQTRYNYTHSALNKPADVRLRRLWRSSRDSARTPVQWDDSPNAGFTTADKPWFHVNPNYRQINVAYQEADPDSILHFYRKAIALRKSLPVVRHGTYREHFRLSGSHYVYSREMAGERLLVICSFSGRETKLPLPRSFDLQRAELLLCTHENPTGKLCPWESRVYRWGE